MLKTIGTAALALALVLATANLAAALTGLERETKKLKKSTKKAVCIVLGGTCVGSIGRLETTTLFPSAGSRAVGVRCVVRVFNAAGDPISTAFVMPSSFEVLIP